MTELNLETMARSKIIITRSRQSNGYFTAVMDGNQITYHQSHTSIEEAKERHVEVVDDVIKNPEKYERT